jgi:AraC family transcriptional regulator, regulatory protein of adaptative response / methylated-DNA-[protein]-cysteine methyltransferase
MLNEMTSLKSRDDRRWQAVQRREVRGEDEFVYAVRSTGIYCRASCPSRRPRRDQVSYFAAPDAAEAAGYRACLRCRPREARTEAWIEHALREIENAGERPLRLAELAARFGRSPSHFQRRFRQIVGVSPRQYAEAQRLRRFKQELRRAPRVTDAVYDAGFSSSSRAYEGAARRLGMTPGAYRRGGEGVRIAFTVVPCAVGELLVAMTGDGLAAVSLGDDAARLSKALRDEYPNAEVSRDDRTLRRWARAVSGALKGRPLPADLPIDVHATAFEWKVWEALRRIPRGETRTYAEVARSLGRPGAARAVGRACARNRLALVIPCHRVVPAAGGSGRYRWGAERKRALLEREKD